MTPQSHLKNGSGKQLGDETVCCAQRLAIRKHLPTLRGAGERGTRGGHCRPPEAETADEGTKAGGGGGPATEEGDVRLLPARELL